MWLIEVEVDDTTDGLSGSYRQMVGASVLFDELLSTL